MKPSAEVIFITACRPFTRAFSSKTHQQATAMALMLPSTSKIWLQIRFAAPRIAQVQFSSKAGDGIPKNVLADTISADKQQENGVIYDKKPFKLHLDAAKKYSWCLCGRSKSQPLCDGTHKNQQLKIKQKPIRFQVEESKEYWLCNCKQTNNRPFCDGTHKLKHVQEGTSIVKQ